MLYKKHGTTEKEFPAVRATGSPKMWEVRSFGGPLSFSMITVSQQIKINIVPTSMLLESRHGLGFELHSVKQLQLMVHHFELVCCLGEEST